MFTFLWQMFAHYTIHIYSYSQYTFCVLKKTDTQAQYNLKIFLHDSLGVDIYCLLRSNQLFQWPWTPDKRMTSDNRSFCTKHFIIYIIYIIFFVCLHLLFPDALQDMHSTSTSPEYYPQNILFICIPPLLPPKKRLHLSSWMVMVFNK